LYKPTGIARDISVTPPRIYVADFGNNRILAWNDAVGFTNGKPADLVIGQRDFFSTASNGPGPGRLSTGFDRPTGLAVDQGDLYVADSGNNRVLRFRKPFATPPGELSPDMCIGQPSFNTNSPNYPLGQAATPTDKGIALNTGSGAFVAAITFDAQHNLWLADAGNNRVLRFAAADVAKADVTKGTGFGLTANLEIGQLDFISRQPNLPSTAAGVQTLNQLATPAAIAFDTVGRLYIADSDGNTINRVLVFLPPFTTGMSATRVMGAQPATVAGVPRPDPQFYSIAMLNPSAIFFLPGTQGMGVLDSGYSRILIFDGYDQWPDAATAVSPSAKAIYGHSSGIAGISHTDGKSLLPNDGNPQAAAGTLYNPQAAVFVNNDLYVADYRNNRVVVMPWQSGNFGAATRVLGQDRFNTNSVNLIEGREFSFRSGNSFDAAVVIDSTGDTPHLYVSDPYNNRVLGFRDVRKLKPGSAADIVIGQPDLATALCNYPNGDINQPTQSSLCRPIGLLVDNTGNLYVADSNNGRVLRFPTPFSHQGNQQADLVLGKSNFFTPFITDATARNMYVPYGLAFAGTSGLLVSDQQLNRVLFFPFTNGTFSAADNGTAATKVFGQPDFTSSAASTSDTGMAGPHHLSSDTDGRPYVVDSGNGRVLIFDSISNTPSTGAHASFVLPAANPEGIFVNQNTGEIWVTDLGGAVRKYPRYDQVIFNPAASVSILANSPIAVTQDQYGDLIVAEALNRVTFYYPKLAAVNNASYQANKALAPNTIASIFPYGIQFGKDTALATDLPNPLPLPKTLADIQVTVNGTAAPLYFVSPGQINIVVPWDAPTTGTADVQVLKVSTGQLLAAGAVPMNTVSPAIYAGASAGAGAKLAAVINYHKDGSSSINDATHPAKPGEYISIYATGQGLVANPPADGDNPRNGLVGAQGSLRVLIGTDYTDQIPLQGTEQRSIPGVDNNFISFSGLSPGFPGMWQVNVRIPQATAPGTAALLLFYNSVPDNVPAATGYRIVFYVAAP
ncbi:MAG: hypothetical protein NTW28_28580, partial [Candidatus Solibacter sp.]|nr:hypothetical protein [Candidatus Solibacter sp.]